MVIKTIKRKPAEQLAAEELRKLITSGEILPGTRLLEVTLSEQMGISRGTLRIALFQLSREGLIVQTPYTGWAVATIAPDDLWELYTLRAGLEAMAVRLACEQLDAKGEKELSATFDALLKACESGHYSRIAERDFELHQKIIELSKHKRLAEHYRLVEQQIRIFVATTYHLVSAPQSVIEHHEPMVRAILARDANAAATLLEEHAISEGRNLHQYLIDKDIVAVSNPDAHPDAPPGPDHRLKEPPR